MGIAVIEGVSAENVARASEKLQAVMHEVSHNPWIYLFGLYNMLKFINYCMDKCIYVSSLFPQ